MKVTETDFNEYDKFCGIVYKGVDNAYKRIVKANKKFVTVTDPLVNVTPVNDISIALGKMPTKFANVKAMVEFYILKFTHPNTTYDVAAVAWVDGVCRLVGRQMLKTDSILGAIPVVGGSVVRGINDDESKENIFYGAIPHKNSIIGKCRVCIYPTDSVDTVSKLVDEKFKHNVELIFSRINKAGKVVGVGKDIKDFMVDTLFFERLEALMNIIHLDGIVGEKDSDAYKAFIAKNFSDTNISDISIDMVGFDMEENGYILNKNANVRIFIKDSTNQLYLAQYIYNKEEVE